MAEHQPKINGVGVLSGVLVLGQLAAGGRADFALAQHPGGTGFVSHLRDLRAACIGGDGGGTQMVSQEVFHAQLCQGARPDRGG